MKKVTRQQAAQILTQAAHHHATLSQDDMDPGKEQPPSPLDPRWKWVFRYVADTMCLLVGTAVFIWTHDILAFLLLYGIATGQIDVREVVGMFLARLSHSQKPPEVVVEEDLGD